MNFLVAALACSDEQRSSLEQAATALAGGHRPERSAGPDLVVLVSDTGGGVVGRIDDAGRVGAVYGSGLRACGASDAAARRIIETSKDGTGLLDGEPDDLVALYARPDDGHLVVAAGRGNHRLFRATLPGGAVAISSHLGLLLTAFGSELSVDRSREDFLLGYGFLPAPHTVVGDITEITPGTRLELTGHETTVTRPSVDVDATGVTSFDDAVDEVGRRFDEVMEEQARDDTRHAVLLGGLDSALVASSLRRMGHDVDTFTFGFGDARYEQRHVGALTDEIGATPHWVRFTPELVGRYLETFPDVSYQTGAQPHYQIHTVHAAELIRDRGYDHVWTGDGCDAVFLGYPTVSRRAALTKRLGSVPPIVAGGALSLLSSSFADDHLGHVARMARSTLASRTVEMPARGHLPTRYLDDTALRRLRVGPPPPLAETVDDIRRRLADPVADLDPMRLAFHGNGLTGQSRAKVDGAVAASGIAQSSPFLHPRLKGFVGALPTQFLRPDDMGAGDGGKALLVEMVRRRGLLPEAIITQPKQSPSDSPIDGWYAGPLRHQILHLFDGLPFDWDRTYVDTLLRPKWAEQQYRDRVSLSHHTFQVIGLLSTYAAFSGRLTT